MTINALNRQGNTEDQQIAQGVKVIKELENQNVVEVQEKIDSIKIQNGINTQEQNTIDESQSNVNSTDNSSSQSTNYKSKFESSVIVGDSRAEGIYGYGVLSQSSVVAKKGRNLVTAMKNGDIDIAIGMYPKNIFLTYGINDIEAYQNSDTFIKLYGEVVDKIQSKLPNTNIYICSILPVTSSAASKQPKYNNISSWNQDIQNLCSKKGVTYLDASSVLANGGYEPDGIHFGVKGIKKWLDLFIQSANL